MTIALSRGDDNHPELFRLLNGDLPPADMERARVLIEQSGAREETIALADDHLHLALAALDRVPLAVEPKDDLVAIARFVTERDR